jgi:hypothetical protein
VAAERVPSATEEKEGMSLARALARAVVITAMIAIALYPTGVPRVAEAADDSAAAETLTADLGGKPIAVTDVAKWFCHDFAYPQIHCFSSPDALESQVATMMSTAAVEYVTVYEFPTYAGSYMHISEDYSVLALLGWNDRISSFKGRSGESGHFFKDWFYGGTAYGFCCNVNTPYLGSFDDSFSSVHRS